jgi:tetratricopeptide (TPR) repeat protein
VNYSEEEKKLFALGQERSRNGDAHGAAEIFQDLVDRRPNSAVFAATLANALGSLGNIEKAEQYFKTAVSLAPRSEKFSLGLFHYLWGQRKQLEALDEMKRFMSLSDSQDYREILSELPKSDS